MFSLPFLLFVVFPALEITLLVLVGGEIGFWWTVAALLAAGVLGAQLAKHQGVRTLLAVQERLARGETPADAVADGAMLLLAGILFILPGYLSDLAALILLIPPCRGWLRRPLLRGLSADGAGVRFHTRFGGSWSSSNTSPPPPGETVIDGEFTRDGNSDPPTPPRLS